MAAATLKKRAEFVWVRGGLRWSAPAFVLEARVRQNPGETEGPARFGYTVSKKVGGAVVRNRVRRRLKALTAGLPPGQARPGFDYVIIARSAAIEREFADLRADLERALTRVHQAPGQKRRGQKNA